jgi:hypothetical protein
MKLNERNNMSAPTKEEWENFFKTKKELEIKLLDVLKDWREYNRDPNCNPNYYLTSQKFYDSFIVYRFDEEEIVYEGDDRAEDYIPSSFFLDREKWEEDKRLKLEKEAKEKIEEEKQIKDSEIKYLKKLLEKYPDEYYWDEKILRFRSRLG